MPDRHLTYSGAGVDVDAGEGFVRAISRAVKSTHEGHGGRVLEGAADFAGLFRLGGGYADPVLVAGADGVGTKLLLAQRLGRHDSVGVDLVAMCVNDILTAGAEPLFFLDYIATGRVDREALADVVSGVARGCREAGCALIGGETAEMPDLYPPGAYDLAGFAVGVVERRRLDEAPSAEAGDVILALPSSGVHSNGYSLLRQIFDSGEKMEAAARRLRLSVEDAFLAPTRIYAHGAAAVRGADGVSGIAHITGGGIPGNVRRMVPDGLQAVLRPERWPLPPIFPLIQEMGPVAPVEMYRTFNMGLGLVLFARAHRAESLRDLLAASGEEALVVGEVVRRPEGAPPVIITGV